MYIAQCTLSTLHTARTVYNIICFLYIIHLCASYLFVNIVNYVDTWRHERLET